MGNDRHIARVRATQTVAGRVQEWAWTPLPLFVLAALIVWASGSRREFNPPFLVLALNALFAGATSFFVAHVAARNYTRSRSTSVLLLGCGALTFGTASLLAGLALHFGLENLSVGIHNSGACLAGIFHLVGVFSIDSRQEGGRSGRVGVAVAYGVTVTATSVFFYEAIYDVTPVFYEPGAGFTPLRYIVLGGAVASFALAGTHLGTARYRGRSSFGWWYALALGLIAIGLAAMLLSTAVSTPINWLGRAAQYLGGCYMVAAVVAAYRRRGNWEGALETALRESEERLSLATMVVPLGGFSRDLITGKDYWSPELKAIYGIDPGEPFVLRRYVSTLVHPDDRRTVLADIRASLTQPGDSEFTSQHRFIRPDGEVRWIQVRARVITDWDGRPVRAHGFAWDVTDQERTRQELFESRKLLQQVLENSLDAAYRRDLRTETYDYVSPVVKDVLGLDPKAMQSISTSQLVDRIHPDDRAGVWDAIAKGTARGSGRIEYRFERSPGDYRWLADYFTVQKDAHGRPTHRSGIVRDITHQKQIEQALRESERFMRDVLNNLFVFVGVLELDGTLIEANDAPLVAAGLAIGDVRGKKFWDCYWWNYDERVAGEVRSACARAARGELVRYDVPVRMAHGMRMVIDFQIAPLRAADGTITHLIPSAVDVTERAAAEGALRDSELFYRQTLESIPGMVFTTDAAARCDFLSQQWVEFTGMPAAGLLGDGWTSLLHPEDRPRAVATWHAAVEGRSDYDVEYRLRRHDGAHEWFKVRGRPIRDADGRIVRWFGAAVNIDALKRAEAERERLVAQLQTTAASAEQARAQLEAVFEAMVDGVMVLDMDGAPVLVNESMLDLCSLAVHEDPGFDIKNTFSAFDLFDECGRCLGEEDLPAWRVLHGESLDEITLRAVCRATGRQWSFSFSGEPVRNVLGDQILAVVIARDVTKAKAAEEVLRRSHTELEQRVRERTVELRRRADQLARLTSELTLAEQRERRRLAQVLHDHLQQLLVGANFGLQVLLRRVSDEQTQAVSDVQGLINEAISASRSLTVELSPPILHEAGLAAGLEWLARWMEEKHGLRVVLRADEEAHTDREDVRVLVFQSVRELLLNAVKHAGVTTVRVELALEDADHLRVTVEDSGTGFDPQAVMDAGIGVAGGFGLFSIRERLALLHGRFEVRSAPGEGSAFHIIAPMRAKPLACQPVAEAPQASQEAPVPDAGNGGSRSIRLLIVDDHEVMRQGLAALLADEEDIEVVGDADDGPEAILQAQRLQPDVILMDFSMPGMDGIGATRRIRELLPRTRVIGLSMYESRDRANAMVAAGAYAYLTKSGSADILLDTIRKAAGTGPS